MYGSTIIVISDALFSVLKQTDRQTSTSNKRVYITINMKTYHVHSTRNSTQHGNDF